MARNKEKILYSDKGTILKNGKDRSSVVYALISLFFIVGMIGITVFYGLDILILFVGIVGLAANLSILYMIRKNHKGTFEVNENGIRFPKPSDAFVKFSEIKGFKTQDRQMLVFHTRYMEIKTDEGKAYWISNRKLRGADYVTADFVKVEKAIRERWNEING